jgi:hypothetical protein
MFVLGQEVMHCKTQGLYKIVGLPAKYILEKTREHAYAYEAMDGDAPKGVIFMRCQKEMEDGRFVPMLLGVGRYMEVHLNAHQTAVVQPTTNEVKLGF